MLFTHFHHSLLFLFNFYQQIIIYKMLNQIELSAAYFQDSEYLIYYFKVLVYHLTQNIKDYQRIQIKFQLMLGNQSC